MFELFKKKKPTTDPMQAVIDEMMLYGQPFRQYIEKMDIVDDKILQLQMRILSLMIPLSLKNSIINYNKSCILLALKRLISMLRSAQRIMARTILTTTPHSPILSKPIIPPKNRCHLRSA